MIHRKNHLASSRSLVQGVFQFQTPNKMACCTPAIKAGMLLDDYCRSASCAPKCATRSYPMDCRNLMRLKKKSISLLSWMHSSKRRRTLKRMLLSRDLISEWYVHCKTNAKETQWEETRHLIGPRVSITGVWANCGRMIRPQNGSVAK